MGVCCLTDARGNRVPTGAATAAVITRGTLCDATDHASAVWQQLQLDRLARFDAHALQHFLAGDAGNRRRPTLPRNNIWLQANPWFALGVVPALQARIRAVVAAA
jgi:hypothetical protein